MLNRISVGEVTGEDMTKLKTRCRKKDDKDLLTDALCIMLTNEGVNKWNAQRLNQLVG